MGKTYSEIKKDLNIKIEKTDSQDLAYLTHFLQSPKNGDSKYFKPNAVNYLDKLKENESVVKDRDFQYYLPIKWDVPFPPPEKPKFKFIDLFAGIGGFRIPFQQLGGKCVFSSEFNQNAKKTYEQNFGEVPFGDITKIAPSNVPEHDILCAGFPCQPFSISGKKKGFEDTRGTVIYNVLEIIDEKRPTVVFLENVKHLLHHDSGNTIKVIVKNLENLGYQVSFKVLNASNYGLPQNRERIVIIGSRGSKFAFENVKTKKRPKLSAFLEKEGKFEFLESPYTLIPEPKIQRSGLIFAGYLNKNIRKKGVRPGTENLSRVHKQPNRIYSSDGIHPTLASQESAGRYWIQDKNTIRKLTINECYKIMGFPNNYKLVSSKGELYRQIGNSVAIPMILAVAEEILTQNKFKNES